MIYKNDYGGLVVQFGTGDIEVSNGRALSSDNKKMYPCCCFLQLNSNNEIGAYTSPSDNGPAKPKEADVVLAFTNPRSIDVVIDALIDVKNRFKLNGSKVLTPQEITDEL